MHKYPKGLRPWLKAPPRKGYKRAISLCSTSVRRKKRGATCAQYSDSYALFGGSKGAAAGCSRRTTGRSTLAVLCANMAGATNVAPASTRSRTTRMGPDWTAGPRPAGICGPLDCRAHICRAMGHRRPASRGAAQEAASITCEIPRRNSSNEQWRSAFVEVEIRCVFEYLGAVIVHAHGRAGEAAELPRRARNCGQLRQERVKSYGGKSCKAEHHATPKRSRPERSTKTSVWKLT